MMANAHPIVALALTNILITQSADACHANSHVLLVSTLLILAHNAILVFPSMLPLANANPIATYHLPTTMM